MSQDVDLLDPALTGILFTESSLVRKADDSGVPLPAPANMDFRLAIAGELLAVAPTEGEPHWQTVAKLKLMGRGTPSDADEPLLLDVSITSLGYFPHPEGSSKELVEEFNESEFNLVRLLMQMYPATILKLTTLCDEAGFEGLKLSTGMPPRRPPDAAEKKPSSNPKSTRVKRRSK